MRDNLTIAHLLYFFGRKGDKQRMIKKKKLHRVYGYGELWDKKKIDFPNVRL